MSQRSLRKQIEGSDYEDKWSQQADDMGWMSNHEKRKEKSKKEKNRGKMSQCCSAIATSGYLDFFISSHLDF